MEEKKNEKERETVCVGVVKWVKVREMGGR